jgi:hypothetical protein
VITNKRKIVDSDDNAKTSRKRDADQGLPNISNFTIEYSEANLQPLINFLNPRICREK